MSPIQVFEFIDTEKTSFPIAFMCRRLGVSCLLRTERAASSTTTSRVGQTSASSGWPQSASSLCAEELSVAELRRRGLALLAHRNSGASSEALIRENLLTDVHVQHDGLRARIHRAAANSIRGFLAKRIQALR